MEIFVLLKLVLLLLFLQQKQINATAPISITRESDRIVGGVETSITKAKFVVIIRSHGNYKCGGALVTAKFVITAAHCVEKSKASDLSVVGGATYLTDKGVQIGVSKIHIPKDYIADIADMDIAVLELSGTLKGDNIATIELCKRRWRTNDRITIFGWGQTSEYIENNSNKLRMVTVPIIDHTRCRRMYKGHGEITRSMFCAGNLRNKDACIGDSGGPAVFKNQLCGVISWGRGCARHRYPGVYTNVMYVRDFIDKSMNRLIK